MDKQCTICGIWKSIDQFNLDKRYGRARSYCKVCHAKTAYDWTVRNHDHFLDTSRKYRKKHLERIREISRLSAVRCNKLRRETVLNHYGTICNCCGETENRFLTVDHIYNDGAKQRKLLQPSGSISSNRMYTFIIKNGFPNDLQILCWNCNHGKALNGGICPHKTTNLNSGST